MSAIEIIKIGMFIIKPLIPCILTIAVCTLVAFLVIIYQNRNGWISRSGFTYMNFFFSFSTTLSIQLACAWIKMITVCYFVFSFTELEVMHYFFLLIPCVVVIVLSTSITELFMHVLTIAIQLIGVLSTNILCQYILKYEMKPTYIVWFVLIACIIVLYNVYVFITEIDYISIKRSVHIEKVKKRLIAEL